MISNPEKGCDDLNRTLYLWQDQSGSDVREPGRLGLPFSSRGFETSGPADRTLLPLGDSLIPILRRIQGIRGEGLSVPLATLFNDRNLTVGKETVSCAMRTLSRWLQ